MAASQAQSIRQNPHPDALPDFRNVGVVVRILLFVNGAALAAAAVDAHSLRQWAEQFTALSVWAEPALLAAVVLLYIVAGGLLRLPYHAGVVCALAAALAGSLGMCLALNVLLERGDALGTGDALEPGSGAGGWLAQAGWTLLAAGTLLEYFRLRNRAFSPALSEARLQALQARIRPHFLFNSINAVLSLMRSDPKRAEGALEDLAELFRTLMADTRALTSFGEELALTRRYLALEHLRLADRLAVDWQIDPGTEVASVPPLLLQPLVENAVYHGIEPGMQPGRVDIHALVAGDELRIMIANPYHPEHQHRQGNRMALANIRERLQLHFDVDARLETEIVDGRFLIHMRLPLRRMRQAA